MTCVNDTRENDREAKSRGPPTGHGLTFPKRFNSIMFTLTTAGATRSNSHMFIH